MSVNKDLKNVERALDVPRKETKKYIQNTFKESLDAIKSIIHGIHAYYDQEVVGYTEAVKYNKWDNLQRNIIDCLSMAYHMAESAIQSAVGKAYVDSYNHTSHIVEKYTAKNIMSALMTQELIKHTICTDVLRKSRMQGLISLRNALVHGLVASESKSQIDKRLNILFTTLIAEVISVLTTEYHNAVELGKTHSITNAQEQKIVLGKVANVSNVLSYED